jgi:hypothetical protein
MEGPQEDLNKSLEKGSCKFPSVHVRVTLLPPLQRQPADFPPRVMDPSPGQAVKNVSVHNSVQKRWLQTGLERSSRQRNQNINPFLFLFFGRVYIRKSMDLEKLFLQNAGVLLDT